MSESEHFVQFYENDAFLLDSLSGFIDTGLAEGGACIVLATKAHRESLEERLQKLLRPLPEHEVLGYMNTLLNILIALEQQQPPLLIAKRTDLREITGCRHDHPALSLYRL